MDHQAKWLHDQLSSIWTPPPTCRCPTTKRNAWWTTALARERRKYWKAQHRVKTQRTAGVIRRFHQDNLCCRNRYRQQMRRAKQRAWAKFLLSIRDPWGAYYKFLRGNKQRRLPLLTADPYAIVPISPHSFLQQFAAQLKGAPRQTQQPFETRHETAEIPPPLAKEEIDTAMQETTKNKAAGPDGIPPIVFHKCYHILRPFLHQLYSQCLQNKQFPTMWKAGEAFLLPKAGREMNPTSYWKDFRVITLLPVAGKIFERILLNRLRQEDEAAGRQFDLQHGFRPGRSCQTALLRFIDEVQHHLSRGLWTAAIFFDIAGAFDTVPHQALLRVMNEDNYSKPLCAIIEQYLQNRHTRFTLSKTTLTAPSQRGTPQGGVLSPYLWNVYINSLLSQSWETEDISIQAYADDLVVWAAATTIPGLQAKLQAATVRLEVWGQQKNMHFQPNKTRVLPFRYRGSLPQINVRMQGTLIQTATSHKYLGLCVDARHNWLPHLRGLIPRTNALACRFLPSVRAVRPVPRAVARRIYVAAVRPVLLYAYGVWSSAAAKRGVAKLLHRATRPFLLSLAHAPATTANTILHKLVALPDMQTIGETHTVWLIASTPELHKLYLVPWAATPVENRQLQGRPVRKHIYSLLDKHALILSHIARCEHRVQPRERHHEVRITIGCNYTSSNNRRAMQRRWRAGNWILTSWCQVPDNNNSIIMHFEPPNHSTNTPIDTYYCCHPHTWLPFQFLQALARHMQAITPGSNFAVPPLLLQLQAPTITIARRVATLIATHWNWISNHLSQGMQTLTLHIQLFTLSNPPSHPLWPQLNRQHPTVPKRLDIPQQYEHTANQQSTMPQYLMALKHTLKERCHSSILPERRDNRIFKEFFPSVRSLNVYATTARLSWALGHLVTNQHPLNDHLHRTGRADSDTCPTCSAAPETVEHFLFDCLVHHQIRSTWQHKWAKAVGKQFRSTAMTPRHTFKELSAHTISADTFRALDDYVNATKRFFNDNGLGSE